MSFHSLLKTLLCNLLIKCYYLIVIQLDFLINANEQLKDKKNTKHSWRHQLQQIKKNQSMPELGSPLRTRTDASLSAVNETVNQRSIFRTSPRQLSS